MSMPNELKELKRKGNQCLIVFSRLHSSGEPFLRGIVTSK